MQPMGLDSQMGQAGHVRPAWRMTGSVRMFWMLGSAMAFSRRCASSSSDTSPLLICGRIGQSQHPDLFLGRQRTLSDGRQGTTALQG